MILCFSSACSGWRRWVVCLAQERCLNGGKPSTTDRAHGEGRVRRRAGMRNGMDVQNVLDARFLLTVADWAFDSFPQACAGHLPGVRVVSKRRHRFVEEAVAVCPCGAGARLHEPVLRISRGVISRWCFSREGQAWGEPPPDARTSFVGCGITILCDG